MTMDHQRLSMSVGEAMFTQRAIRRFRPDPIPTEDKNYRAAAQLAEEMRDAPCVVLALAVPPGSANSVIPACQNLMLAARALGICSVPTTLHAKVMDRLYALLGIPKDVSFHFSIP